MAKDWHIFPSLGKNSHSRATPHCRKWPISGIFRILARALL
jgi:hypothetical protein